MERVGEREGEQARRRGKERARREREVNTESGRGGKEW